MDWTGRKKGSSSDSSTCSLYAVTAEWWEKMLIVKLTPACLDTSSLLVILIVFWWLCRLCTTMKTLCDSEPCTCDHVGRIMCVCQVGGKQVRLLSKKKMPRYDFYASRFPSKIFIVKGGWSFSNTYSVKKLQIKCDKYWMKWDIKRLKTIMGLKTQSKSKQKFELTSSKLHGVVRKSMEDLFLFDSVLLSPKIICLKISRFLLFLKISWNTHMTKSLVFTYLSKFQENSEEIRVYEILLDKKNRKKKV